MADVLSGNAAIGQSGGSTAVSNQSLVGVIEGLQTGLAASGSVRQIFGMKHGVRGLTEDGDKGLVPLSGLNAERLEGIAKAPAAALDSTHDKPDDASCARILDGCKRHDIRYIFYIGGIDAAETCRIVSEQAAEAGYEMACFHVPETIENDLTENDHTPGYASAARFVTLAFMGDGRDNASLGGIKINVVTGRHAGFLTAAAALARGTSKDAAEPWDYSAAHLIYLPELPFNTNAFLADVEAVYDRIGRCQIALSEAICDEAGNEIGPQLLAASAGPNRDAHSNVPLSGTGELGDGLAELIKKALTPAGGKAPRVRADTFGTLQRCWPDPSLVDAAEARAAGRYAAEIAANGGRDVSIVLTRETGGAGYRSAFDQVDLSKVARHRRPMPEAFIAGINNIAPPFYDYALPLVGALPVFGTL